MIDSNAIKYVFKYNEGKMSQFKMELHQMVGPYAKFVTQM